MLMLPHKGKFGFTFVELSIVLVIIALLIGGVIVGQDLIRDSRIRAQISQITDIENGVGAFQLKYGCLPGDCSEATNLFGTNAVTYDANGIGCNNTVCNGNGDGNVKSAYQNATYIGAGGDECLEPSVAGEISQLFKQLSLAGFGEYARGTLNISMALIGKDYPYVKYGNNTGIFVSCLTSALYPRRTPNFLRRGNIIVVGSAARATRIGYSTGSYSVTNYTYGNGPAGSIGPAGIPADVARIIDEKIDEGKPSTGKFGILAGSGASCDNSSLSNASQSLLTSYPSPSTVCDVTVGKRID